MFGLLSHGCALAWIGLIFFICGVAVIVEILTHSYCTSYEIRGYHWFKDDILGDFDNKFCFIFGIILVIISFILIAPAFTKAHARYHAREAIENYHISKIVQETKKDVVEGFDMREIDERKNLNGKLENANWWYERATK